jgi:hypothetical protein
VACRRRLCLAVRLSSWADGGGAGAGAGGGVVDNDGGVAVTVPTCGLRLRGSIGSHIKLSGADNEGDGGDGGGCELHRAALRTTTELVCTRRRWPGAGSPMV